MDNLPFVSVDAFHDTRRHIKVSSFINPVAGFQHLFHQFFRCKKGIFEAVTEDKKRNNQRGKGTTGAVDFPTEPLFLPLSELFTIIENVHGIAFEMPALYNDCLRPHLHE